MTLLLLFFMTLSLMGRGDPRKMNAIMRLPFLYLELGYLKVYIFFADIINLIKRCYSILTMPEAEFKVLEAELKVLEDKYKKLKKLKADHVN